ncbi:MAG: hypothetical protein AAFU79_15225 [Myxococcota bacterium]
MARSNRELTGWLAIISAGLMTIVSSLALLTTAELIWNDGGLTMETALVLVPVATTGLAMFLAARAEAWIRGHRVDIESLQ